MDLVVIIKLSAALLEMLYPVEACVLNLRRKTLLYLTTPYVNHKYPRNINAADVLLERGGHKPDTAISQLFLRISLYQGGSRETKDGADEAAGFGPQGYLRWHEDPSASDPPSVSR